MKRELFTNKIQPQTFTEKTHPVIILSSQWKENEHRRKKLRPGTTGGKCDFGWIGQFWDIIIFSSYNYCGCIWSNHQKQLHIYIVEICFCTNYVMWTQLKAKTVILSKWHTLSTQNNPPPQFVDIATIFDITLLKRNSW